MTTDKKSLQFQQFLEFVKKKKIKFSFAFKNTYVRLFKVCSDNKFIAVEMVGLSNNISSLMHSVF